MQAGLNQTVFDVICGCITHSDFLIQKLIMIVKPRILSFSSLISGVDRLRQFKLRRFFSAEVTSEF